MGILASRIRACFPAGTVVWVVDDATGELIPVPIEQVRIGERVWSYDPDTGEWEACVVEGTSELAYDGEFVDVQLFVNGMGPLTDMVSATGNHPFWVVDAAPGSRVLTDRPLAIHHTGEDAHYVGPQGGRWVQARHLSQGDILLLKDGSSATVCGLTVRTERTYVYNLSVERLHNYAVGASGVCVHNGGTCIVRRGTDRESVSRLKKQAQAAEDTGRFPHGVSGTSPASNKKLSSDPADSVSTTRQALEDAGIPVHDTPTRNDPDHMTIELPKPITTEVRDAFNTIFGR